MIRGMIHQGFLFFGRGLSCTGGPVDFTTHRTSFKPDLMSFWRSTFRRSVGVVHKKAFPRPETGGLGVQISMGRWIFIRGKYEKHGWFEGTITGNSDSSWENLWFPVIFSWSQPIDIGNTDMRWSESLYDGYESCMSNDFWFITINIVREVSNMTQLLMLNV